MAKFVQGPRSAGYNAEPLPRVTGEDLNGNSGGESGFRYGTVRRMRQRIRSTVGDIKV